VPRIQIEEVLAFYYTMFRRQPVGKHLQACRNVACSMRGAEGRDRPPVPRLGVQPGGTTPTAASP
jgi:NADH:ubiquinone oxidoreductase subunit E